MRGSVYAIGCYNNSFTAVTAVAKMIKNLKGFSFILLITAAPVKAPAAIAGIIRGESSTVLRVTLFQKKICNGIFAILIIKNNQVIVPKKLFFEKPFAIR